MREGLGMINLTHTQKGTRVKRISQTKIQIKEQQKNTWNFRIRSSEIPGSILLQTCCVILRKSFPLSVPWFLSRKKSFPGLKLWGSKLCKRGNRKLLSELWRGLWSTGTRGSRENQGYHWKHNAGFLFLECYFVYLLLLTGPYWSLVWSAICSAVYNAVECSPAAGTDQPGGKRRNTLSITWPATTYQEPTMRLALY